MLWCMWRHCSFSRVGISARPARARTSDTRDTSHALHSSRFFSEWFSTCCPLLACLRLGTRTFTLRGSFAVENIKPQAEHRVVLLRHGVIGWASDGLRNLDFNTGPLSLEMPRYSTSRLEVRDRSSCPWFECTSHMSLDLQLRALRSTQYSRHIVQNASVSWYCFARGYVRVSPVDTCLTAIDW